MIQGVNIITGNTNILNINRSEGSGGTLSPSVGVLGGRAPLENFLAPNKYLDWLKIDMNSAKIITVQGYKYTKN